MRVLIGIDDTDNLVSRGTGHRARQMSELIQSQGLARPLGITRHQLLVSPEIPYTSHNSSACVDVDTADASIDALIQTCRDFLLADSAPGSDAGLCVATWEQATAKVQDFGIRAKQVVLKMADALDLAAAQGIVLEGLTGTGGGVIGSLAGIGLHAAGNDGRFLWLPGIRELQGRFSAREVLQQTGIEELRTAHGDLLPLDTVILLGEWTRPILNRGKAVLLCEEVTPNDPSEWRVLDKEIIKQRSQ